MASWLSLLLFLGFVTTGSFQVAPAQCGTYLEIRNQPDRSTSVISNPDEKDLYCDSGITPGWYRIIPYGGSHGSSDLSWKPPIGRFSCNTKIPIYIKATSSPYPTALYQTITVPLCIYMSQGLPCFSTSDFDVKITNCGDYNVYELSESPIDCPEAYCFDERTLCPPGFYSESGYEPCTDEVPTYNGAPVVKYRVGNSELVFHCDASGITAANQATETERRVRWYMVRADDITGAKKMVHEEMKETHLLTYELQEEHWKETNTLGVNITCEITGFGGPSNFQGQTVSSPRFFAGFKVDITTALVVKGDGIPRSVTITPTVPIMCPPRQQDTGLNKCGVKLSIRLYTRDDTLPVCSNGKQGGANLLMSQVEDPLETLCGVIFEANMPGDITLRSATLKITGRRSDTYAGDGLSTLALAVAEQEKINFGGVDILSPFYHWSQKLPDVTVKVENENIKVAGKTCWSNNDPHMITFGQKRYELHVPGDYILYKHEHLPIQVQTRYNYCNGKRGVTCNCGIAIQSGKDVFMYDLCDKMNKYNRHIQSLRVGILGCDNKAMHVEKQRGGSHKITLPTGTVITISAPYGSGNLRTVGSVKVTPSPQDWGFHTVGGLCGILTETRGQNFKTRGANVSTSDAKIFSSSWKVGYTESLFKDISNADKLEYKLPHQCTCESPVGSRTHDVFPEAVCDVEQAGTRCSTTHEENILRVCRHPSRRKREVLDDADFDIFAETFEYVEYNVTESDVDLSWKNGWDTDKAKQFCDEYLRTHVPPTCMELENINLDYLITSCVTDIQLVGNTDYAMTDLEALTSSCQEEVMMNTTMWTEVETTNTTTKVFAPPEFVLKDICPSACNLRGNCTNGVCQCQPEYTGADCSVNITLTPSELYLPENGLCDLQARSCENAIVYGLDLTDTIGQPICQLREFVFNNPLNMNTKTYTGTITNFNAVVLTPGMAKCQVSTSAARKRRDTSLSHSNHAAYGYDLSLSNNGVTYSDSQTLIVFDSACFDFDPTTQTGNLRSTACIINGVCHTAGEIKASDSTKECNPTKSRVDWSDVPTRTSTSITNIPPSTTTDATEPMELTTPATTLDPAITAKPPTTSSAHGPSTSGSPMTDTSIIAAQKSTDTAAKHNTTSSLQLTTEASTSTQDSTTSENTSDDSSTTPKTETTEPLVTIKPIQNQITQITPSKEPVPDTTSPVRSTTIDSTTSDEGFDAKKMFIDEKGWIIVTPIAVCLLIAVVILIAIQCKTRSAARANKNLKNYNSTLTVNNRSYDYAGTHRGGGYA